MVLGPNQFGARKVLAVARFDRRWINRSWIARLPQEDFCQALGVSGESKYENQGGPGIQDILRVLDTSSRAAEDKRAFVKAQLVARLAGLGDASELIEEVAAQIPGVIAQVKSQLPKGFPMRVRDSIFAGIRQQAERLVPKARR